MSSVSQRFTLAATTLAAALTLGAQQPAPAAAPAAANPPKAGEVVGEVTQWKGVVKSVDYKTRWVVVQGPQGNGHAFRVQKSVTNLDKVKVGDTLTVDFVESVAIFLRKATEPAASGEATSMTVKTTGLPAAEKVAVHETQVNVTAVDQAKRSMTVIGPGGNSYTFMVDPRVTGFSQVKVGDQLVIRYTEAIAVKVTK